MPQISNELYNELMSFLSGVIEDCANAPDDMHDAGSWVFREESWETTGKAADSLYDQLEKAGKQ
jgi:hypothetical protein